MSVSMTDQSQFPRRIRFDWIGESFSIYGKNAGIWIGATLISVGVSLLVGALFGAFTPMIEVIRRTPGYVPTPMPPGLMIPYYAVSLIVSSFFYAGLFRMAVKAVRGEQISLGDLFGGVNIMLPMLGYTLLFGLAVFAGAILCILPVFVVYTALWPGFALIADGESVGNAMSRSWNAVKQDWLNAGLFSFVMILLVTASYIPCGLGLFVTIPMIYIIGALIYRDMIGMPGAGLDTAMGGPYYAAQNTAGVWPPPPTQGVPPASNPFAPITNPVNPFPSASEPANPFPPLSTPPDAYPPSADPYAPPSPNQPPREEE